MGRWPCCDENGVKKGPWTAEEDKKLVDYIQKHGHASWRALPKLAGLNRCGKSCRLRWTNYLRPDIKRGSFSRQEEQTIIHLHSLLGNKWSAIASQLPGRTDNEIKNFWNTHLRKKLLQMGIDPVTHRPRTDLSLLANLPQLLHTAANIDAAGLANTTPPRPPSPLDNNIATQLAKIQLLQNILQVLTTTVPNPLQTSSFLGTSSQQAVDELINPAPFIPSCNQFSSLEAAPPPGIMNTTSGHHDLQFVSSYSSIFGDDIDDRNNYQMPALVPASSEISTLNPMESKYSSKNDKVDVSNPSSTTTTTNNNTFECCNEIMDDEASNSYWRDIIDQASSPLWPI